ncbi:MAG TPA: hypothetical protein VND20_09030 [Candidatus Binataceae bacterium]|nr:hypothetical protein [Candidatus Binataceae bacterium]
MIVVNTTDTTPVQNSFPPSTDKVFVTDQALPANVDSVPIARIDEGKVWYGSIDALLDSMADRARQLGANAIVNTKTWHQPSGFSWYAPEGSGQAVHVKDIKALDTAGIQGTWH